MHVFAQQDTQLLFFQELCLSNTITSVLIHFCYHYKHSSTYAILKKEKMKYFLNCAKFSLQERKHYETKLVEEYYWAITWATEQ